MGYFSRQYGLIEEIVKNKKLSSKEKTDLLADLAYHEHCNGSWLLMRELLARLAGDDYENPFFHRVMLTEEQSAGVSKLPSSVQTFALSKYGEEAKCFYESAMSFSRLLNGTGIEWDGSGLEKHCPTVKEFLAAEGLEEVPATA